MALYTSPKTMISDTRLNPAQRQALEDFMPKIEHKSQLIADLNFVRTIAKKKAAFYWDVNSMVSHRAPDLTDSLVAATLSDAQVKHEDALKQVRGLTDKINTVTKELNAVVKFMHERYKYYLSVVPAKPKTKRSNMTKSGIPVKPAIRQNCIRMSRHELCKFISGLATALRSNPNENDFCINLITKARGN